ncbi:MAG: hypothetical protein FJ216_06545 [Ignavibacteria bacterium]|nr:hypothetical protein [Ignavibacteria bacterium]
MEAFKHPWLYFLRGLLFIIIGIYAITVPVDALLVLVVFIGAVTLVTGFFQILSAIFNAKNYMHWGLMFVWGIVEFLFGLILITKPGISVEIFLFIFGFWAIATGVFFIGDTIGLKKSNVPYWWLNVIAGILMIILGYIIITNPFSAIAITIILGIEAVIYGIFVILCSFGVIKYNKNLRAKI